MQLQRVVTSGSDVVYVIYFTAYGTNPRTGGRM